jgi:hypothetical protein
MLNTESCQWISFWRCFYRFIAFMVSDHATLAIRANGVRYRGWGRVAPFDETTKPRKLLKTRTPRQVRAVLDGFKEILLYRHRILISLSQAPHIFLLVLNTFFSHYLPFCRLCLSYRAGRTLSNFSD